MKLVLTSLHVTSLNAHWYKVHQLMHGRPIRLVHMTTVPQTLAFLDGQVEFMKAHGFEVILVSSPGIALEETGERLQAAVRSVPMKREISPLKDVQALFLLIKLFLCLRPTIVHTHTAKASLLGMAAAFLARVPVRIYTLHGLLIETRTGWKKEILSIVERFICLLAHRVFAVSPTVRDEVISNRLCPAGKVCTLGQGSFNGIDTHKFDPKRISQARVNQLRRIYGVPDGDFAIGFVGRISSDKGITELALAWQTIRSEFSRAHLILIGPQEPYQRVEPETIQLLKNDKRVVMVIWTEEMPEHYALLDLLVLPSYREGFPYAVLEASAMGLPVVATKVTGCIDAVVDGETGILVRPHDVGKLVEAIRGYVNDKDLCRRHGHAGRERALRDFRREPIWEALLGEYLNLVKRTRKSQGFGPLPQH